MKQKEITGYLFNTDQSFTGQVVLQNELSEIYKLLNCDLIDVVVVKIGDRVYDAIVDDEGLLKDGYVITAINPFQSTVLAGNILIVKSDSEGNFASIKKVDVKNIENHIIDTITADPKLAGKLLGYSL